MLTKAENVRPDNENIGLIDRMVRFVIGAVMLGSGLFYLGMGPDFITGVRLEHWLVYGIVVSFYPLMTAILGVDPLYHLFGINSGSNTGRNQSGSFPYQVKAALDIAPKYCENDDERSLEACHDKPVANPHHVLWEVEQEPMLYPDDAAMAEFSAREKQKAQVS